jgi:hypothetical protein
MFTNRNQLGRIQQLPSNAAKGEKCTIFWLFRSIYQSDCPQYPRLCLKFLRRSFLLEYTDWPSGRAGHAVGLAVRRHLLQKEHQQFGRLMRA